MTLTSVVIAHNMVWSDVIPLHTGCQAFFRSQKPYDDTVTARIQARLTRITEDEQRFAYPPHICLILAPIWLLPYAIAAPLWTFLQLALFLTLPLLVFNRILKAPLTPLQLLAVLLLSLFGFRYTMMTAVLGQFTGFTMLCLVVGTWALGEGRDGLAALALAAMTVRAEGAIFAGAVILLALYRGQRRTAGLWAGLGLTLWLGTRLFIGSWEGAFLTGMRAYNSYNRVVWIPVRLGIPGVLLLGPLVAGWLAIMLWRIRQGPARSFWLWAGAIITAAGLILVPQTNQYTLVYLLPGFYLTLHVFRDRWWAWALILALLALPWGFFILGRAGAGYDRLLFPLALAALITAALTRQATAASPRPARRARLP